MTLSTKEEKILNNVKRNLTHMRQITRLEKEISTLEKKLERKNNQISEIIDLLDGKETRKKKNSYIREQDVEIVDASSILN